MIRRYGQRFDPLRRAIAAGVLLAAAWAPSPAQHRDVRFRHIGNDVGLSQSSISSIAQDSIGFLWFGTEDGLNRFDGYRFTVFRHNPADSSSISDNYIWRLLRSRTGDLWIGTLNGGLNRYEVATGHFIAYRNIPGDSTSLSYDNVTGLFEDRSGALWVGTWGGGLCRLDSGSRHFVRYRRNEKDPNTIGSNYVSAIREDGEGMLWIGTREGVTRFDRTRGIFSTFRHSDRVPGSLSNDEAWDLLVDRHDDLWVATRGGLNRFDRARNTFECFRHDPYDARSLSNDAVSGFLEDRDGGLWVGTTGGVDRFIRRSGKFDRHHQGVNPADGPGNNLVISLYQDRSGVIWFGTYSGLSCYDPVGNKFRAFVATPTDPRGVAGVRGVCRSQDGGAWIGTDGHGVAHYDELSGVVTRYRAAENDSGSLSSDRVLSVLEQRDGTLWVATSGDGLNRLRPHGTQFEHFVHDPRKSGSLSYNSVIALLEARDGSFWVGTNGGGLDKYDPARNGFVHYRSSLEPTTISGNWIWSLFEDRTGAIWVGTWTRGLNRFDRASGRFQRFLHDPADSTSISNNSILSINEDDAGTLWIGTHGGGLNRFDRNTGRFTHYTERDGLSNNIVLGILPDDQGRLWLGTNKGVSRFTPATGEFRNYDVNDGLQSNEFDQGACCRLPDGTMFLGGVGGLNVFRPGEVVENSFVPPVVITDFSIFGEQTVLPRPPYATERIALSYNENYFSFDFVALSFSSAAKNRYMYKLDGFDQDWVKAGTRRVAYYTNVPPGQYTFRVKASNNDGVWNDHGVALGINIAPPFWATWEFRALVVASVLAGGFMLYRRRVRALERERTTQQEFALRMIESQESERKRIAAELHDSLGQDLLVIRNRAILGLKDSAIAAHARDQLDQISAVATQAINGVREISYGLRPYQLDRLGLTKAIRAITAHLATNVRFSIEVEQIDEEIEPDKAIHLYRIIQEGINNILKHAGAASAKINIHRDGDAIRVTIADDGKGMTTPVADPPGVRSGIGLMGIRERARVLGGSVTIDSHPGRGTELTVLIPRRRSS